MKPPPHPKKAKKLGEYKKHQGQPKRVVLDLFRPNTKFKIKGAFIVMNTPYEN